MKFPKIAAQVRKLATGKGNKSGKIVSENNPKSMKFYSAEPTSFDRSVPLHTHNHFIGRKVMQVDAIKWPAQTDYPKVTEKNRQ